MKTENPPIMDGSKVCICCKQVKHVTGFHVHKHMKDGRLNKCAPCVVETVNKWRASKPDARKNEHKRVAERDGIKSRAQWRIDIAKNAIGRKVSALKYSHKRAAQKRGMPVWDVELDGLAIEEAKRLADKRTALTGFEWSVDHIVPMNHRQATGLHNAFNLNVAPAVWNSSKANRHMRRYFGQ